MNAEQTASMWEDVVVQHNADGEDATTSVGRKVRELRQAAKLSQRELASRVGVSFPHISKIEAGREPASTELLTKIAREVNGDPDELLLLADHLPDGLQEAVAAKPELAPRFLRSWKAGRISDEAVRQLLEDQEPDQ
jgi:transcriptional regulator with XRE-family HTH domain